MDVIEFVIQKKRYCHAHFCNECVIYDECRADNTSSADAAKIVEEIKKWTKSHPLNTRATKFFEPISNGIKEYRWLS